jgi:putative PIN family toxin of toxin-antitoxin system
MRPRRLRAVLDTQLLIRAFHTARGATGGLVRALQDDRFHLISSEPLLEELRRTFYRPEVQRIAPLRPLLPHEIEDNIASVRAIAAVVVPGRYQVDLVSTDPKDNPVLACAIEGLADYVVTGHSDCVRCRIPANSSRLTAGPFAKQAYIHLFTRPICRASCDWHHPRSHLRELI